MILRDSIFQLNYFVKKNFKTHFGAPKNRAAAYLLAYALRNQVFHLSFSNEIICLISGHSEAEMSDQSQNLSVAVQDRTGELIIVYCATLVSSVSTA